MEEQYMLTAKQAMELADLANIERQMKIIEEDIFNIALHGKYEIFYYQSLFPETINRLREKPYLYNVEWDEAHGRWFISWYYRDVAIETLESVKKIETVSEE